MQTEDFCHCYVIISVLQVIHGEYLLTGLDWTTDWTGRRIGLDRSEVKSGPHAPRGPLFGLKADFKEASVTKHCSSLRNIVHN